MSENKFPDGKKFLVNQYSLQQLVGEFKICVDRLMGEPLTKYTSQEFEDVKKYIKEWEDLIY